jgi:hypothetical protein
VHRRRSDLGSSEFFEYAPLRPTLGF